MREKENSKKISKSQGLSQAPDGASQNPYQAKDFFESIYSANIEELAKDSDTIGLPISEFESRFHYNSTENSIIRGFAKIYPPPPPQAIEAWKKLRAREQAKLLDIGSGTGHWIDFFTEVFDVRHCVGVELTDSMAAYLTEKYANNAQVNTIQADITDEKLDNPLLAENSFDFISAIGVMFHIVEDSAWRIAMQHLGKMLSKRGLMFIGGEFGSETKNVQFHTTDQFKSWQEFKQKSDKDKVLVNKRVRSLDDWKKMVSDCNLHIIDLIRSDRDDNLLTPENDILIVAKDSSLKKP